MNVTNFYLALLPKGLQGEEGWAPHHQAPAREGLPPTHQRHRMPQLPAPPSPQKICGKQLRLRWREVGMNYKEQQFWVLADRPEAQQEDVGGGGEGGDGWISDSSFPMPAPTPPFAGHIASRGAIFACFFRQIWIIWTPAKMALQLSTSSLNCWKFYLPAIYFIKHL